jgi:uncharacterized protein with HEPN domain
MIDKDRANLNAICDAIRKIKQFVENKKDADDFFQDEIVYDASLMNFVVIGESASKISEELRNANKQIPFTKVKDFRNMIAHDYFGVDAEVVWQIIHHNLPDLEQRIKILLED